MSGDGTDIVVFLYSVCEARERYSIMWHVLVTLATLASLPSFAIATSFPRVLSTSGTIIGRQASNRSGVTEFLGIRYAEAPVGDLRFAATEKYVAPAGTTFEASEWVRRSNRLEYRQTC